MSHKSRYCTIPVELRCDPCEVGDIVHFERENSEVESLLTGEKTTLPMEGRAVYVSPRGWATLEMLSSSGKSLYNETVWFNRRQSNELH